MAVLARDGSQHHDIQEIVNQLRRRSGDNVSGYMEILDTFIQRFFVYRSESEEVLRTIPFMMEWYNQHGFFEGDCDCISILIAAFLKVFGFQARFVAIRTEKDNPDFLHVFTEGFDGKRWFRFDPTVESGTLHIEFDRLEQYV